MGTSFDALPFDIFRLVDSYLSFEESLAIQEESEGARIALRGCFSSYDTVQASDDPTECWLFDSRGWKSRRRFREENLETVLRLCTNIQYVTIGLKDGQRGGRSDPGMATLPAHISLYLPGGYVRRIMDMINCHCRNGFKALNVHVDVMFETISNILLPCPTEDLTYLLSLSDLSFEVFIQISFCCVRMLEGDSVPRQYLLRGMENAVRMARSQGAQGEFVMEPSQGYVDMTVEHQNIEYSFAFFYYNPSICDPMEEDNGEEILDSDEQEEEDPGLSQDDSGLFEERVLDQHESDENVMLQECPSLALRV